MTFLFWGKGPQEVADTSTRQTMRQGLTPMVLGGILLLVLSEFALGAYLASHGREFIPSPSSLSEQAREESGSAHAALLRQSSPPLYTGSFIGALSLSDLLWGALPLSLPFGMAGVARMRQSRIRRDSEALLQEVESTRSRFGSEKRPPKSRRQPPSPSAWHGLASLNLHDDFSRDALCRAANLSHFLGRSSRTRLEEALKPLSGASVRAVREREASCLAACILESDPEQAARFNFLALEGELEAEAARAWWEARV